MVLQVSEKLGVSKRRACKVLAQARSTQRRSLSPLSYEKQLTDDIIALATRYGRYGYRRITALLNNEYGWKVNHKRVERIWRKSAGPGLAPHTHEYNEILAFFGTNPDDIHDLGGDLEIWLEDEKHEINKSCLIFIPAGMKHCPLRTTRLERPIIHFAFRTEGKYA